ncbi:MAG: hypothetical protein HC848_08375 [Limnobacter sp.]|nr:hypothetical protein [Limnobacter sp.]
MAAVLSGFFICALMGRRFLREGRTVLNIAATTLSASNADLLNGHLHFADEGGAGAIQNAGTLQAHSGGSVVLLAPRIENTGIVHADGEVLLAAGHSVTPGRFKPPHRGFNHRSERRCAGH